MIAGLVHLAISAAGSFVGTDFPAVLGLYGYYSGSVSKLSFFAPGVGSQLRVLYHGLNESGITVEGSLLTGRGETDLRIAKIVANFWRDHATDELRRALAASWAGTVFGKNPNLVSVTITLDSYDLPSMRYFREGYRPKWRPYYYATFDKAGESR
jgi:hypothetical protein